MKEQDITATLRQRSSLQAGYLRPDISKGITTKLFLHDLKDSANLLSTT